LILITAGLIANLGATSALAQQNFVPGFAGLKVGTQPPPGIYAAIAGWGYSASTVVDRNGDSHSINNGGLDANVLGVSLSMVTKWKLLGGNYGFAALASWVNSRVEIPSIGVSNGGKWGLTSTYLQPISLGWSTPRADYLAGYAIYLPTGAWTFRGSNNFGLGMYTQEFSGGSTFYLDAKKSTHLALELVYDINSRKQGTTYTQSDPLTLQGGLGHNYGDAKKLSSGWFGVAGFGQWTVNPTSYGTSLGTINGPYPRSYGLGPEFVTIQGALTLRYEWEFGSRSALQGPLWAVFFAAPI